MKARHALAALAAFAVCGFARGANAEASGIRFDGYMKIGASELFALSVERAEAKPSVIGWRKLGQSFGSLVLSAYDPATEVLSLTGSDQRVVRLHLVTSKTPDPNDATAKTDFDRAMAAVAEFRAGARKKWDTPVEFTIDGDGSMMSENDRNRFLAAREKEESKGGYLIGVSVGGEWIFSRFSGKNSPLIPKSLSSADREKVEIAWAFAHAEAAARLVATQKQQKASMP